MTNQEMRRQASLLCDIAGNESWQTLRAAILDFGMRCKSSGPRYSEEAVQALKEEIAALKEQLAPPPVPGGGEKR